MEKGKYEIYRENGREYLLVSQAPEYAREFFKTRFGIPSYRTIRLWILKGFLKRPEKLGRKTFFELSYIMAFIAKRKAPDSGKAR